MIKVLVMLCTAALIAGCSGCSTTEQYHAEPIPVQTPLPTPDTSWNDLSSGLDLQSHTLEK